jgi:hypothetical protein
MEAPPPPRRPRHGGGQHGEVAPLAATAVTAQPATVLQAQPMKLPSRGRPDPAAAVLPLWPGSKYAVGDNGHPEYGVGDGNEPVVVGRVVGCDAITAHQ